MAVEKITCTSCSRNFEPTQEQTTLIQKLRQSDSDLVMLKCPNCWMSFGLDLKSNPEKPPIDIALRCPVSRCSGLVSLIENPDDSSESAWSCSNCGSYWTERTALEKEIVQIVKTHPYRSRFYIAGENEIIASNLDMDQKTLDLVEQEPVDSADDYCRG